MFYFVQVLSKFTLEILNVVRHTTEQKAITSTISIKE